MQNLHVKNSWHLFAESWIQTRVPTVEFFQSERFTSVLDIPAILVSIGNQFFTSLDFNVCVNLDLPERDGQFTPCNRLS